MRVHNLYNTDVQSSRKRELFRRAGSVPLGCGHVIVQPELMEKWLDFAQENDCVVTLGENWMSQGTAEKPLPLAGRIEKFKRTCGVLGEALFKRQMTLYAFITDNERSDETELRLAESIMWQGLMRREFKSAKQIGFRMRCGFWRMRLQEVYPSPYDPGEPFEPDVISPVWYSPQDTYGLIKAIQLAWDDAGVAEVEAIEKPIVPWIATFAAVYAEANGSLVFGPYDAGAPAQSEWLGRLYSQVLNECCAYYCFGDSRVGERGMEHWEAFLTGAGQ